MHNYTLSLITAMNLPPFALLNHYNRQSLGFLTPIAQQHTHKLDASVGMKYDVTFDGAGLQGSFQKRMLLTISYFPLEFVLETVLIQLDNIHLIWINEGCLNLSSPHNHTRCQRKCESKLVYSNPDLKYGL